MLYVTGDTHGDFERFFQPGLKKLKKGDTLFICGDFGFIWNNSSTERKMLKKLGSQKYNICFLDGTHENFELLRQYPLGTFHGGLARRICGNLYHLQRGQIYEFEDRSIFVMGGGESPDIDLRYDKDTWSSDETPVRQELLDGAKRLQEREFKVDFILTHEPPTKIKGLLNLRESETVHITGLSTYLEELSQSCEFKKWFFGSMHVDKFISATHIGVYKNIVNMQTGEVINSSSEIIKTV
ncbi:MAG: metallophosphoesterase [Clostridia bacterium]|nr:metallophosphoesterase [Clostridia bacterium]